MARVERAHHLSTVVLASALCAVGVVMLVSTLARGGGPSANGVLLGGLLAALGAGRLLLARRAGAGRGRG